MSPFSKYVKQFIDINLWEKDLINGLRIEDLPKLLELKNLRQNLFEIENTKKIWQDRLNPEYFSKNGRSKV